jgi:hypothetical protein
MKICLYTDETVAIRLEDIISNLNRLAPTIRFRKGNVAFNLADDIIENPKSYRGINHSIDLETDRDDEVLLFTEKPYDNNFFFDSDEKKIIVSSAGWDHLTTLSRNNGVVYVICAIIIQHLHIGQSHRDRNTCCINDFLGDKTGIDVCMRTAFLCPQYLDNVDKVIPRIGPILREIEAILNDLSTASRSNTDVCDFWAMRQAPQLFDVLMCHNSDDKDALRPVNRHLKRSKIKTWFDEEQLPPWSPWQDVLEEQIAQIRCAAVFVGNSGLVLSCVNQRNVGLGI